jgi:hypothetical protein
MEEYKYSHVNKGTVKHIQHNDGMITMCGLQLEFMTSIIEFSKESELPVCKKCLRISKIVHR